MSFQFPRSFPFNRATVTIPTVSDAAYEGRHALLPVSGGDEGLAEACRLWWMAASFTLTLTASSSSNTETLSFSRPSFPTAANKVGGWATVGARPDAAGGIVWAYSTTPEPTWGPDPTSGYQVVGIRYAQDVNRWCLVLSPNLYVQAYDVPTSAWVTAEIGGPGPSYSLTTSGPDELGYFMTSEYDRTSAGSVSVLGYSFPLYKVREIQTVFAYTLPAGSVSATSTSTFY